MARKPDAMPPQAVMARTLRHTLQSGKVACPGLLQPRRFALSDDLDAHELMWLKGAGGLVSEHRVQSGDRHLELVE
jgi:hypothetical protein